MSSLTWCVIKVRNKQTGNQFYDFSKYSDLDLLRVNYNVVVLASFSDYQTCIDKILDLEKRTSDHTKMRTDEDN